MYCDNQLYQGLKHSHLRRVLYADTDASALVMYLIETPLYQMKVEKNMNGLIKVSKYVKIWGRVVLISGLFALLAIMIWNQWLSGTWAVGTLVGVQLMFSGVTMWFWQRWGIHLHV